MNMAKSSDPWSIIIVVVTCALFVLAVFIKGFTHELLSE